MADLYWFPFFCRDWLSSPARLAMLPEQRGAYIDLLALAWGNGSEQPSLPADDVTLAALSGLGARWKRLGPLIRAQFMEGQGRLYNEKLTEVWHEQQSKHDKAVERGKIGGRAKAAKRKTGSSSTREEAVANLYQSESEEAVEPFTKALPASAPIGALALEGARAPALAADGTFKPWVATEPVDPDESRLHAEYFERLQARADTWAASNPDDAMALEVELRGEMGLPQKQELSGFQQRAFREQFLVAVRELKKWPDVDEWVRLERARLSTHPVGNADRAANDASEAADD